MTRHRHTPAEAPLLAWAERRPAAPLRSRRWLWMGVMATGIALVAGSMLLPPTPRFIWNATASVPIGLYRIEPHAEIEVGDIVVAWAPETMRRLAADRGYLPAQVPLVKSVGAIAGDEVCAFGQEILINGQQVGDRQLVDGRGRPMPAWQGCVRPRGRALFLFSPANPQSFDSRYFGVVQGSHVIGKARLLWAR